MNRDFHEGSYVIYKPNGKVYFIDCLFSNGIDDSDTCVIIVSDDVNENSIVASLDELIPC